MTKIEKETILAALCEYGYNREKEASKAYRRKDYAVEAENHKRALIAGALITQWHEILSAPCGEVKI